MSSILELDAVGCGGVVPVGRMTSAQSLIITTQVWRKGSGRGKSYFNTKMIGDYQETSNVKERAPVFLGALYKPRIALKM